MDRASGHLQTRELLDKLHSHFLTRAYVERTSQTMLSPAYGEDWRAAPCRRMGPRSPQGRRS